MKRTIIAVLAFVMLSSLTNKVPQLGKDPVDEVVKAMTLDEKVHLIVGTGMPGFTGNSPVVGNVHSLVPGAAGVTYPIPRLGIPSIVLADGPAGLRIKPTREGSTATYYCTAFPVGTLLASTWNADIVESVGLSMGNEVLEYGVDVLLAPALNIHRNPLCGRNFEYYSEDPLLAGKTAAAVVRGVQHNGVGTSIKHFAANNQETNRMMCDSRISQRALREIYLKGFEIAVKESKPWTVMSSYNYVNGVYTSESYDLLTTILRSEWGYGGLVMTDWFGGKSASAQVHAGNDLLMPGFDKQYNAIIEAVKNGTLAEKDVDVCVTRILELILQSPRFKGYPYTNKPDLKAHAEVSRRAATEGMVLLRNNNNALPFGKDVKRIAAYGITSYELIAGGTGSGDVNRAYTISIADGLNNAGYQVDKDIEVSYHQYVDTERQAHQPDPNNPLAQFMPKYRPDELVPEASALTRQTATADVAVVTIGRISGEFKDRKIDGDFELTAKEQELIAAVCKAYHAAQKKVIVVLNIGGVIETASWNEKPDAILLAWQPGQEGGNAIADILSGKVNPSGKLTMTFPVKYMDAASSANFPYNYVTPENIFAQRKVDSLQLERNVDYTNYEEDIYVGYRYFDSFNKAVSYPFGFGLSYTSFGYSDAKVNGANGAYSVSVKVTNTGKCAGKEVVQLYVSAPANATLPKPAKELKAYAKTRELKPGESQVLTMPIAASDLASFDASQSAWVTDKGEYKIQLGTSSRNITLTESISLTGSVILKVNNVLQLQSPLNVLKKE
jgi:beta-glucosidase